ncbi:MAG: cob(I)yrinic acid a,c-diamide adenosyltransferase [Oscillospiraceae bacterium]
MQKGCLQVYTGDGKGKTTAAAGLAVRALGRGLRVGFFQFLKDGSSGEIEVLRRLGALVAAAPLQKFVWEMTPQEKEGCAKAQGQLLAQAAEALPGLDLAVLDEAACACTAGMLLLPALLTVVRQRPLGLELVVTGRGAPAPLLELADYVTEMRLLRHPYDAGLAARSGIEF